MFEYTKEEKERLLSGEIEITKEELRFFIENEEDIRFVDTSKITDMSNLFEDSKYKELDLLRWNMSNLKNASHIFSNCYNLKTLRIKEIPDLYRDGFENIFENCPLTFELETSSGDLIKKLKRKKEKVRDRKEGYVSLDVAELFLTDVDGLSFEGIGDTTELKCSKRGYVIALSNQENGEIIKLNKNHIKIIEDNQLLSEKSTVKKEENKPKRNRLKM